MKSIRLVNVYFFLDASKLFSVCYILTAYVFNNFKNLHKIYIFRNLMSFFKSKQIQEGKIYDIEKKLCICFIL